MDNYRLFAFGYRNLHIQKATCRRLVYIFMLFLITAFIVQMTFIYSYGIHGNPFDRKKDINNIRGSTTTRNGQPSQQNADVLEDLPTLYNNRLKHIQAICKLNYTWTTDPKHLFCMFKGYNVSYCKVPKCGSTLWMQIADILEYGISSLEKVKNTKRYDLHRNTTCSVKLSKLFKLETKVILMSRDPFARLYSAFIDKSYLSFEIHPAYIKVDPKRFNCTDVNLIYNESFQEFLDRAFVILKYGNGNPHWMPISDLCSPCLTETFLQIKLEDFSKDMKYVFSHIGFSEDLQNSLKTLSTSKLESLTGIAATFLSRNLTKKCKSYTLQAERLWKTFQLQGYINDSSKFPIGSFDTNLAVNTASPVAIFMKFVSQEMKTNSLTKEESAEQRRKALVNAYSKVNPETISMIQDAFKMDFLMFNYSTNPPGY